MPNDTAHSPRTIGAVDKTCQIIDFLHQQNGARVTELAEALDISKGNIHTHLATLRQNEFVVKDGDQYNVSLRFLAIGEDRKNNTRIYEVAKPKIDELATETDTRVQITVEEFGMTVVLAISQGEHTVASPTHIGNRDYLHCVAAGKAMLAHMSRDRVKAIFDQHGLPARTRYTITDLDDLFDELETIRERGVAFNDEEKLLGLRAVGCAICDDEGTVLGAISASGPTNGMQGDRFQTVIPNHLRNVANAIELDIRVEDTKTDVYSY